MFLRPSTALLAVVWLCACTSWLAFAAETSKKKKDDDEDSSKPTSTKTAPATKSASTSPKGTAPAKPPSPKTKSTSTPEKKTASAPATKPKASPSSDKPKMTTPAEPPPRDVTSTNRANAQSTGSSDHGEFDKADEEQEAKANAAASRRRGTASSSSDMAGWELVRYQERDYVPAASIHKFYRFNTLEVNGNNVWFRSPVLVMKATLGSQDLLINNIKFVLSDPVIELQGKPCFSRLDLCKLIDPVLRPSYIGSGTIFDTVIIDPGHGGHDSGARGIYGYEKEFALKLGFALKADLEKRGLKVVMTRRDDTYISLGSRVAYANKIPNSIYVSLHFNSGQGSATGIETFAFHAAGGFLRIWRARCGRRFVQWQSARLGEHCAGDGDPRFRGASLQVCGSWREACPLVCAERPRTTGRVV